jgi:hypothetical protein
MAKVFCNSACVQVIRDNTCRVGTELRPTINSPLTAQEELEVAQWLKQSTDAQIRGFLFAGNYAHIESIREQTDRIS